MQGGWNYLPNFLLSSLQHFPQLGNIFQVFSCSITLDSFHQILNTWRSHKKIHTYTHIICDFDKREREVQTINEISQQPTSSTDENRTCESEMRIGKKREGESNIKESVSAIIQNFETTTSVRWWWWWRQSEARKKTTSKKGSDANGIGNSNSIRFDGFEHFLSTKFDDAEIIDDNADGFFFWLPV